MTTPKIRQLLPPEYTVPTLPDVVLEVQRLVANPEAGTRELGQVVARDAPLLAKVLKLANSAFYGLAGRCTSATHACTVLGSRTVSNIVTHVGALEAFEHLEGHEVVREVWDHSQRVADLCGFLAGHIRSRRVLDPSDFYTYGLLHDIGKIVLIDALGEPYVRALHRARGASQDLCRLEQEEFGMHHAEVGAYVVNQWSLPDAFGRAFLHHHGPAERVGSDPEASVVFLADTLDHLSDSTTPATLLGLLEQSGLSGLGIDEETAVAIVAFTHGDGAADAE